MSDHENIQQVKALDAVLRNEIIGQEEIIPKVLTMLQYGQLGLTDRRRPKGTALFLGPTGVGKTELTKVFTRHFFGDDGLVFFSMSEYKEPKSVDALLGLSAGNEGRLGTLIKRAGGQGVILLDEIEKAHPQVLDLLLQILDEARITIGTHEVLNLSAFYIVCTSNLGAHKILDFEESIYETLVNSVKAEARLEMRPEIFGRFEHVLVFNKLTTEVQVGIAQKMFRKECELLLETKGICAKFSSPESEAKAISLAVDLGVDTKSGARNLRTVIADLVRGGIARWMLTDNWEAATSGRLHVEGRHLVFQPDEIEISDLDSAAVSCSAEWLGRVDDGGGQTPGAWPRRCR